MPDDVSTRDDGSARDDARQRTAVRERYAGIAEESANCCGSDASSCCGDERVADETLSRSMGYSEADVETVPDGSNLGLGCGNPTAVAGLATGETVLDLGSGAGFDCFLAARDVGPTGTVIGVDMTPEMVETAREKAAEHDATNVAFRLGEIEHLPVADGDVDVVISNCVVNLSPDKPQVFREAYRVLRPGGRLAISDVVQTAPIPADVRADPTSVAACIAGASRIAELEAALETAGFVDVSIAPKAASREFIREWDDDRDVSEYVVSAIIEARKPPA